MSYRPSFKERLARVVYSILIACLLPLFLCVQAFNKKTANGSHRAKWRERFGFVPVTKTNSKQRILFHCVSVGEVNVCTTLIKQLQANEPNVDIAICTTTKTGSARVKTLYTDSVQHFYLPYDLPFAMAIMLRRVAPNMVVITEVELWPNLFHKSWQNHIPIILFNARMTDRSARRLSRLPALLRPMLYKVSHVCAQGQRDYQNYLKLGIDTQKITLTNNVKFDMALSNPPQKNQLFNFPKDHLLTVVAGSTHEGEEQALVLSQLALQKQGIHFRLVLVPRYPERFDKVAHWLDSNNQAYLRSSVNSAIPCNTKLILVDEMGRLNAAFEKADIAFIGGSLVERGGHNALEAAVHSVPIVMGTSIYNNPEICSALVTAGGLTLVDDNQTLSKVIEKLIVDEVHRNMAGTAARKTVEENIGAVGKNLSIIQSYLHQNQS